MYYQIPQDAKDWFRLFSSEYAYYDLGTEDLLTLHKHLHKQFGNKPNELILEIEQKLSTMMRQYGYEHRYQDVLAKKAGTLIENPVAPTIEEVRAYLGQVTVEAPAIEILQDIDGGRIYLGRTSPLLDPVQEGILKAINAAMPPGVKLSRPTKSAAAKTFVRSASLFDLVLAPSRWTDRVTTWAMASEQLNAMAVEVSKIYKDRGGANIPFHVIKGSAKEAPDERIVTGVILEPDVIDKTTTNPDGTPTGAAGDTYDAVEIQKAMYWWMENGDQTFTYLHPVDGGFPLTQQAVRLLENFQAREDYKEGEQTITKGTWVATTRIYDDGLWNSIKDGSIQAFSIDASAYAVLDEVAVPT